VTDGQSIIATILRGLFRAIIYTSCKISTDMGRRVVPVHYQSFVLGFIVW